MIKSLVSREFNHHIFEYNGKFRASCNVETHSQHEVIDELPVYELFENKIKAIQWIEKTARTRGFRPIAQEKKSLLFHIPKY
jgi:hypothetical protein